jgi:mannose-1-phosphate guanylyltransferase
VTGEDHAGELREQLPGVPAAQIVVEPIGRNTAPAIGLAAALIARTDPQATMVVLPADHHIRYGDRFRETLARAIDLASAGTLLVTIGIAPTTPETGYGYIERGESLGTRDGIALHRVVQFREKPDRATAEAFLAEGRFAWNSGIFLWRARTILDALARHRPALAAALDRVGAALGTPAEAETIAREYPRMEKVPIDKAVMEKAPNVRVLEVLYDWNDVGDWRALTALVPPDARGNTLQGDVLPFETRDSIIVSDDGGLIATLGVDDLVIVQSGGATLVARRDQLDKLKSLVEGLDRAGQAPYL